MTSAIRSRCRPQASAPDRSPELALEPLALTVSYLCVTVLSPAPRRLRRHSRRQLLKIAESIRTFGFLDPILVDAENRIIAGHGRYEAAKMLGLKKVPTICATLLSPEQIRAYRITHNRLAELAEWDEELLAIEWQELEVLDLNFSLDITGFETPDIDRIFAAVSAASAGDGEDPVPEPNPHAVSRLGDRWLLGQHRLQCADALEAASYRDLLAGEVAQMVFTDPPYNVPIIGHVSGLGRRRHREFAMASGEMSESQFTEFLTTLHRHLVLFASDGAIHFVCMDWRHMKELLTAGEAAGLELKNLCIWNKDNGGMGTFYRSKHELIFVFKNGTAPHINNFGLGEGGRYRTNVWDYPGANTFRRGRDQDLAMHPTVKPVALVMDAIKDCSHRKGIILDPFGGSGTTLIAAERTGRRGYLLEIDPLYVDVSVRRWQALTGQSARHAETGRTFDDLATERLAVAAEDISHD